MSATTAIHDPARAQRMAALAKAQGHRTRRASDRAALGAGHLTVADVITLPEWATAQVGTLLMSQRRWGAVKTRKVLRALNIREHRRLNSLTQRERDLIIAMARCGGRT